MARRSSNANGPVRDFRYDRARRKNNPPAGLAPQGRIAERPKERYAYNPHLPPVLRFDVTGRADRYADLLETARQRPLTADEVEALAQALRNHEPWLEWAGKREAKTFEVDPVALHIHERVSTKAILQVARRQDVQRSFFADPELEYHQAVQFYQHDVDWANRLILGDSLTVMSSLAKREGLAGQVQMIYVDPPYGIKFASNFQPETDRREVGDKDLTRELEVIKAYRDTWNLGIHSYLSYLRDRLLLARELLAESGSIFVQIGDENVHLVRMLASEVLGSQNFVQTIVYKKKGSTTATDPVNDYILWFAKDKARLRARRLCSKRSDPEDDPKFNTLISPDGEHVRLNRGDVELASEFQHRGYKWARVNYPIVSQHPSPGRSKDFNWRGQTFSCGRNLQWRYDPDSQMPRLGGSGRLFDGGGASLGGVAYWEDWAYVARSNIWDDLHGEQELVYVVQTNRKVIERCMLMTTDPGDLVLDPTCGSGTTAYIAEQWGRRWITIDTSRVAIAIARQRLLTAKFEHYRLKDESSGPAGGFVYKSVPHITLKSIAQNVALDLIFAKHEPVLAERLGALNAALGRVPADTRASLVAKLARKERSEGKGAVTDADRRRWLLPKERWEEWEVPFDADPDWPEELREALDAYRAAWRAKMDEVNACIAASAEPEELVDQPEVVKGVVRVSGPFTVEAVMPPEERLEVESPVEEFDAELETFPGDRAGDSEDEPANAEAYLEQMLRLLRNDGVRFPDNRQMRFTRLEPLPGDVLHAEGEWASEEGSPRRVAVSFGPQYGPVTAKQVEDCLWAASRRGYDDLVFAGFSFDAAAQAAIQEDPNPRVRAHLAHIRPDVNMGSLLKDTPSSQLFTVFGLPRTRLDQIEDGQWTVTMEGVDVYDPVENVVRSTGADKVAAWFVDGDYDGRTFCITQAFFPDRSAWDKLARALRGIVDEEAFERLSGTTSLPFPAAQHGRVAVKVIDPRGNEVMRVHALRPEAIYA